MKLKLKSIIIIFILISATARAQTLNEALKLTINEQYDLANDAYRALLQAEPKNGTLWFYLGENYWKWENQDSAKISYQKGLTTEPGNALNLVGIGKINLHENKTAEAKTSFDKALAAAGAKLPLIQTEIAEAYINAEKNKDITYALSLLKNASAAEPKNPEIYLLTGDAYAEQNNGSAAAENYNKALDLDSSLVRAIVRKGILYKRSTNLDGARAEFENAIAMDPMFAPAHRELGEIYFRTRKFEKAKEEYRKYLELSKNTSDARLRYASFLFMSKDYPGTLSEISQLNKLNPNNISLLRLSAYTHYETGDTARARELIEKVFAETEESKRRLKDYEYYAKILASQGNDSLAVMNMEKAYSMDSANVDLLSEMGSMYLQMKKYPEAAAVLRKRTEFGKGVTSTDYFNLGKAYTSMKQYEFADTAFARVNEVLPEWPNGYLWRAQVNANTDSTSEKGLAKPFYEKYLELVFALPDTANVLKYKSGMVEAYRYLGYHYFLQKQNRESREMWRKVLGLAPNDKQATEVLKQLK